MPQTPRLSGAALRAIEIATRPMPIRAIVSRLLRKDLGIVAALELDESLRGPLPTSVRPACARTRRERPCAELGLPAVRAWPRCGGHWVEAYRSGRLRPTEAARAALAAARALAARTPSMGPMLGWDDDRALRAAAEADERWRRDAPIGPLDGIPVVVKEEMAVAGLPRQLGSKALPAEGEPRDGTIVARLRQAGAVILGSTPMTEFGMSPIGCNPHRTMPRNPHDEHRVAGGSSTGSAVAVATGLVPVAIGADGGGSIRTPACLTGVFGLKPTFGLLSRTGGGLANSVSAFGPIGASAADLAALLDACAGEDPEDDLTLGAPRPGPGAFWRAVGQGVRGLRIGVDEGEWAAAPDDVTRPGRAALRELEKEGATLVPVDVPLARHANAIGYLTIGLEELTLLRQVRRSHWEDLGLDLRISLRALADFASDDFLDGQRLRSGLRRQVAEVLRDVDLLALPTVGCTAPRVTDVEARDGFVDPPVLDALCRFAFLANLAGLPAATAPVGVGGDGMPVGLQLVGDAWDDTTVIAALAHLERTEVAAVRRPKIFVEL
jgi:aspartyl-tRNA(Asn)/glutamyl-tRNA(Gln) amidotransferase subunit A